MYVVFDVNTTVISLSFYMAVIHMLDLANICVTAHNTGVRAEFSRQTCHSSISNVFLSFQIPHHPKTSSPLTSFCYTLRFSLLYQVLLVVSPHAGIYYAQLQLRGTYKPCLGFTLAQLMSKVPGTRECTEVVCPLSQH